MRPTSNLIRPGLVLCLLLAGACSKDKSDKNDAPLLAAAASSSSAPQSEEELSAVLASIDGVPITVREFQDRINKQSPYIRARYTSPEQKKEFLDNLVRFEVLALEAKAQGFDKNSDVVRTMKQVMIQKLMKERFDTGISPEDVSEEEMQAYYKESEAEFHKPEEVRVSAIIIDKKAVAEATAKLALGEKGASNKGFRELVALHSTDKDSKVRGGDLRYFTATNTDIPKSVIDAAFGLKKTGNVVGPVDGGNGNFYILKQTGHRKAIDKSFDEVKRQIQNRLYRDKRTQAQKDFVTELKAKAKIQTFDDALSKVQIDMSAGAGDGHGHDAIPGNPHQHGAGGADHAHGAGKSAGQGKAPGHSHAPAGVKTPEATP
jgi:peptidyl-prolyl cis-trans isomerase C